ncbi:MAG TPA: hypothetical protein VM101_08745 [Flavitalea sp.]|nr:hypothetical protein [Flavitalea sp.]
MIRIIKLGLISFIVIFIILFLISLMIPSTVRVSRAIDVEADKSYVYPLLADTAHWIKWNELKNDRIHIRLLSSDSNLIHSAWTYGGNTIDGYYRLERIRDVTVVQWYFEMHLKWYPWEKFGSITFEKQFGPPMEHSLLKLKNLVTNSP